MSKLKNAKKILANLDSIVAGTALVILVALTILGALLRYFFNHPFVWLEEVQLWCEVWVAFIGAGAAFRTGSHVAIEIIIDALPKRIQKVFDFIIAFIVIGVIGYLFIESIGYLQLFIKSGRTTSILQVPYTVIYGVIPITCVLMLSNYCYVFYKRMHGIDVTKEDQE